MIELVVLVVELSRQVMDYLYAVRSNGKKVLPQIKISWIIHVTWKCDIRQKLLDLCMCATGANFCIFPAFQRVWTLCVIARKQIFHIFGRLGIWYTYRPSVHQYYFVSKEITSTFQRSGDADKRIGHFHKVFATWRHACGKVHIPENSNICLKILF